MLVKFIFFSFFSITMLESKILDLLCFYLNSLLHYSYQLYSIISYLSQSRFSRGVSDSLKEGLQLAHFGRPSNWLIWRVAVSPDLLLLKMITLAKVVLARLLQSSWKRSWLWVIFIRREDRAAIFRCFFKREDLPLVEGTQLCSFFLTPVRRGTGHLSWWSTQPQRGQLFQLTCLTLLLLSEPSEFISL